MRWRRDKIQRNCFEEKTDRELAQVKVEANRRIAHKSWSDDEPSQRNQMKPEQIAELIDKLIAERLKLHLLTTSRSLGENLDKRTMVLNFEQKIAQIKASLADALRT